LFLFLGLLQTILAARVFFRMAKTSQCRFVETSGQPSSARVTILLPVLNEAMRIANCLESLIAQPEEVAEILVIDGGSSDATRAIAEIYHLRDDRVRWIDASPADSRWTGKAWNLNFGLARSDPASQWILCIDADVRVSPKLSRSLISHAARTGVSTFSLATRQHLSGRSEALVHPPLLTTLVYRFGQPGHVYRNVDQVQANGQCFFSRREILLQAQAFAAARSSLCEDITIARRLVERGEVVGFYETYGLAEVSMYRDWRETWRNWPRSLPMRDQYFAWRQALGLLEVFFVQGLPLPVLILALTVGAPRVFLALNAVLLALRTGVLFGTSRAYDRRPWTYWLSPFCDFGVAVRLIQSALLRKHSWRGRSYVRRSAGIFEPSSALSRPVSGKGTC
jgi:dolichol-phosphate mannosyltransferase